MKQLRRVGAALLCAGLLLGLVPAGRADARPAPLTVLFTHDTHDHIYPDAADMGGYVRLATALDRERAQAVTPVITLDAGDFSMGSLFQTIYTTHAPELRALGAMGYDVTTLGNHEFDYRPQGLAEMLTAAEESGDALPAIVQANYKTPLDPADPGSAALVAAMERCPVTDYVILEPARTMDNGGTWRVKVAVFGVMGLDSHQCAPMSGMEYEPMVDAARRVVAEIKAKEDPDFIICLSHGGTEAGKGEDYELAQKVPGIDLIISGHTHTQLADAIQVNDTRIVSCGEYAKNLGSIRLERDPNTGKLRDLGLNLIPLDASVPDNPAMKTMAEQLQAEVNKTYLSDYGLEYNEVLASSSSDLTLAQTGDYIGKAYLETIREAEGEAYVPIALAVAPAGVVRDSIRSGDVTTAQAFDILSLGSGADGSPGYPLVSVYLTGRDLKNVFEVDASISGLMPAATIYGAGSYWRYNPHRMFLDRVAECQVLPAEGQEAGPPQRDRLYRVVADLYSGQMLSAVKSKSFGLLSITPRDAQGNEITNFEDHIIRDAQGRELKAWYALASYLKTQGAVELPRASKRVDPSWNPVDLVWNSGWPTALAALAVALVVVVIVLVARKLLRRREDKR